MSCDPSSNTLNPPISPPIGIPGFGVPFSFPQIPLPSFDLPTNLLEDFLALIKQLGALFPSGLFSPTPNQAMKDVMDFIANVLSQIAPFLSLFNFIMALLHLIVCIIEVLCAIPNPFAVVIKLQKLFAECLPPFLRMFPYLALILMIIAILLLILALIEYIITTVIAIILEIIENILHLADAIALQDAMAILAEAQKIASLLCYIQNILAILVAIAAIIDIVKALMLIGGAPICADGDEGCCPTTLCPPFIKNTPDGIKVTNGKMIYYKELGVDLSGVLGLDPTTAALLFPPLREERWQIMDLDLAPVFPISLIIEPTIFLNIYWPDPTVFKADMAPSRAPYTVDMTFTHDPGDGKGSRKIIVKDCIVVRKPYLGVMSFDNSIDPISNFTGTLNIEGGTAFESDGKTKIINPTSPKKRAYTLNTLVHQEPNSSATSLPSSDDSLTINNIEFTWKPNAAALSGYNLTTVGCIPSLNLEKATVNAVLVAEGIEPVALRIPPMPDVLGAQQCVTNALEIFRKDVSEVGAAIFQAAAVSCLEDLRSQTTTTICGAIIAGTSQFKTAATINTDVQFTTRSIDVTVILNDPSGTTLSNNIPTICVPEIEALLKGSVTLGEVSDFKYNGSTAFNAQITSKKTGSGKLSMVFNNKALSTVTPGSGTTNSIINENFVDYQFIDTFEIPEVRRDETDVAREGGS